MKNLFLAILTLLGLLAAGCSSSDSPPRSNEIRMTTAVVADTRSAVISDEDNHPTVPLNAWFVRTADAATADWTTVGTTTQTTPGTGAGYCCSVIQTDGAVSFRQPTFVGLQSQFYNTNPDLNSYLVGFYPAGNSVALDLDQGGFTRASWTIDGKTDVLVSNMVSGNRNTTGQLRPSFRHLLTWLEFHIIAEDQAVIPIWGEVTSITINGILPTVSTTFSGIDYNVAYSGTAAPLATFTPSDGIPTSQPLTLTATFFSQAIVNPASAYTVVVELEDGRTETAEVTFRDSNNSPTAAVAGSRHVVKLIFDADGIDAAGTVQAWKDGDDGSGTIG